VSTLRRSAPATSFVFRLRMSKLIRELEDSLLVASADWDESDRARTCGIASILDAACRAEGLRQLAIMIRSLDSLMRISAEQILPIRNAFTDKVWELLALIKAAAHRELSGTG